MNRTDAPSPPLSAPDRPRSARRRAARMTAVLPLATAAAVVAVMIKAGSTPYSLADVGFTVAFVVWNLLPIAGAVALLLWSGRRGWLPYAAATAGSVALAVVTAWGLHDFLTSDSSTAALLFIFLPFPQWTVVVVSSGLVALAAAVARRRAG